MTTEGMPNDKKMIALAIQCEEHGLLLGKRVYRSSSDFLCLEKMTHCLGAKKKNNDKHNSISQPLNSTF